MTFSTFFYVFIDMFITDNYASTLGQIIDQILNIVGTFYMLKVHDCMETNDAHKI